VRSWTEVAPGLRVAAGGVAWLPEHSTVVIADVHLGYARAARRRGGYLPPVESAATVAGRLLEITSRLAATRLVIAGDLRHSTRDVDAAELAEVDAFLDRLRGTLARVDLVAGNHDRKVRVSGAPTMLPIVTVGELDVVHAPPAKPPARWTVCGHLHPSTTVRDETGAGARFPCVMVGPQILVLPAFTEWAGGAHASRLLGQLPPGSWRRIVTTPDAVLPLDEPGP
jgi:uncharacterized protein